MIGCLSHQSLRCHADRFRRLVKDAGLPPIRLHDLRYGAAMLMLAAGIDVKVVSETLGHSPTQLTLDVYQTALHEPARKAAADTQSLVPEHPHVCARHQAELDCRDYTRALSPAPVPEE